MSTTGSKLLGEALHLSVKERARLAAALLASLEGAEDEGVEEAWAAEAESRARRSLAGETALEDWDEVHEELKRRP